MDERRISESSNTRREQGGKKPYSPPVVTEFGSLREITGGSNLDPSDGITGSPEGT